jgi:hypothetical protein
VDHDGYFDRIERDDNDEITCRYNRESIFPNHIVLSSNVSIRINAEYCVPENKEQGFLVNEGNQLEVKWDSELQNYRLRKKGANQQVEPIVTTPVDEVEPQSTQAHP